MKVLSLLLNLLMAVVFALPTWAGTLTTNEFLYKPSLGARGATEKNTFDAGLDRVDARLSKQIWVGDPLHLTLDSILADASMASCRSSQSASQAVFSK